MGLRRVLARVWVCVVLVRFCVARVVSHSGYLEEIGMFTGSSQEAVFRVSDAPVRRSTSVHGRRQRYVVAMSLRAVCFVAMVALPLPLWGRALFAAVAILIPYVAVVAANAWSPNRL